MATEINLALVSIFIGAALGVQISKILKLPSAISLILVGLVFGPTFLNIVQISPIIKFLADIGIILMLFKVGIESDIALLKSKGAILVGAAGFILPWILGYVVTIYFGFGGYEAFFV
ncbi:MAG: cation:proton antiporter, partial [Candidatus Hodarchaeota archaeon]